MSKRRRLLSGGEPSPLLLQFEIDAEEDISSDDDDSHVYTAKFAELFAEPLPVFKVHEYVRKVVHTYSEEQFRRNFRLPRRACYDLIRQFEKSHFLPFDRHHGGAPAKTPEDHILSFLWYAVNKASIRDVALLFNMSHSTQLTVIDRVLGFPVAIAPEVLYFAPDKEALARDFKKLAGFPNVIGCIDGTYIPVRCQVNKVRSTHISRHDQVSITMQGICDSNRRFQDVFTGPPPPPQQSS